jgi:hypothetical protein
MKDQFEQNIKSLVEEFSYDYDPQAWEKLSKKLPKSKGNLSWFQTGFFSTILTISLLGTAVWLVFAVFFSTSLTSSKAHITPHGRSKIQKAAQHSNENKKSNALLIAPKKSPLEAQHESIATALGSKTSNLSTAIISPSAQYNEPEVQLENYISPLSIKGSEALQTELSIPKRSNKEENSNQAATALPCQAPHISLDADAISYVDGLPRIHIKAETNATRMSWSSDERLSNAQYNAADLLAFKAKTYTINVEGILDGCKESARIKITANEDYNLLAVNAFNPQSRDERNATFMPYALTIRQTPFEMLIIDPDNGAIVYRTSDYQQPWDGIDMRSGQMVPSQKAYIWKVVLEQPLPKENSTYTGTIVRI